MAVAATGNNRILVAGGANAVGTTDIVDVFDTVTGTWSVEYLSQRRYRLAAASSGSLAAFAGGNPVHSGTFTDVVDIYDASTATWSIDHLPFAATLMAGAAVGGKLIFAGGLTANGALDSAFVLDVASGVWTVEDMQSDVRTRMASAVDGQRAFFAGGTGGFVAQRQLTIYDSVSGSWTTTVMPHPHGGAAAAVIGDRLYVAGGSGPSRDLIDVYDIVHGTWQTQRMPTERARLSGAAVGPFLVLAGGLDGQGCSLGTADVLNTLTNEWSSFPLSTVGFDRGAIGLEQQGLVMFTGGRIATVNLDTTDLVDIFNVTTPMGTSFCTANPNSTGQAAGITAVGSDEAAANFVTLAASDMPPHRLGMFLAGQTQGFIPFAGGSQGHLCLVGVMARYSAQPLATGSGGAFALQIDLDTIPTTPIHSVLPGETWSFQAWYRDSNPGATSNFTGGVSVLFQ